MALKYVCDACGEVYEGDVPESFGPMPVIPSSWANLMVQPPATTLGSPAIRLEDREGALYPVPAPCSVPRQYNVCSVECLDKVLGQIREDLRVAFEEA